MLIDYVIEGGHLMVLLAAMLFAVLVLALYAAFVLVGELGRARRFRARVKKRLKNRKKKRPRSRDPGAVAAVESGADCLPARFLSRLRKARGSSAGANAAPELRRIARELEDDLLGELAWPLEVLHFLGAYAAKIGLCGTILGLCLHFLTFGTEGEATLASHAMAVALYTTLGALTIALVAEPAAYLLGWVERWLRRDLRAWARTLEEPFP